MLAHFRTRIDLGVSLGLLLIFGSSGLVKSPVKLMSASATLMTGWGLLLYGCANYSKAKGQSEWYGLLAVFFLPGLVALSLLRDRSKSERAWVITTSEIDSALPRTLPVRLSNKLPTSS